MLPERSRGSAGGRVADQVDGLAEGRVVAACFEERLKVLVIEEIGTSHKEGELMRLWSRFRSCHVST